MNIDLETGPSAMRDAIERFDWAATPIGPREKWPVSLATLIDMMLGSKFAMCIGWGPELTFLYNDAYSPILADRHPGALGRPIADVWYDVWPSIAPLIESAMAGDAVRMEDMPLTMIRHGTPEETWWTFVYSPLRDESGVVKGFLDVAIDTSEKVAFLHSLADQQKQLRNLNADLEAQVVLRSRERATTWHVTPYLMSVINLESGKIERVNPAWEPTLGFTAEELEGVSYKNFVHPDDLGQSVTTFEYVQRGEPVLQFENRYRTKGGDWRWLSWVAVPMEGKLYSTARDVTDEKKRMVDLEAVQGALAQSQKMEAVGQLTGGVAHDFNNLLTVIRGSVELLRRPNLPDARRALYMDAISDTAERAAKLTGHLLAFARQQALTPEVFDCAESVRNVAAIIRTMMGPQLSMDVRSPAEPCFVRADRSQFDTAIVNLCLNARDAMRGAGRLIVSISPVDGLPAIRSHAPVAGNYVSVLVSDTGSGIPPANLSRIFEPFFTTKPPGEGTGLGLSQVIGFAKQSGGDISAKSVVGEGTDFTLYLPQVVGEEGTKDAADPDFGPDPRDICVLVVEDNHSVGTFSIQALSELGYDTILARNGEEALAELAEKCGRIHVVFSDVVMPGMSGLELAKRVHEEYPEVPILLTSGYSHVLAENDQHGFEILHKPYSIEQLSRMLRRILSSRASGK